LFTVDDAAKFNPLWLFAPKPSTSPHALAAGALRMQSKEQKKCPPEGAGMAMPVRVPATTGETVR